MDRITRNRRDTLRLLEVGQQAGSTIALVRGTDLDLSTPAGRLTADMLAAIARNEIEVKSDRQSPCERGGGEGWEGSAAAVVRVPGGRDG